MTAVFKSSVGTEVRQTIRHNVGWHRAHARILRPPAPRPAAVGRHRRAAGSSIQSGAVEWLHTDVSGWSVTSQITDITIVPDDDLHLPYEVRTVAGMRETAWSRRQSVGVRQRWRQVVCRHVRVSEARSDVQAHRAPGRVGYRSAHQESSRSNLGAQEGRACRVHGLRLARDSTRTVPERSNIVMVDWPY